MRDTRQLTRAAILLTLALIFQSLRFIIPLPPVLSVFVIGVLVNSVLVFAAWRSVRAYAMALSVVLPCVAYLQGQLPIPVLIPVVAIGNWIYIWLVSKYSSGKSCYLAPIAKAAAMYTMAILVIQFFSMPTAFQKTVGFIMGFAQLVTGIAGILLARLAIKLVK